MTTTTGATVNQPQDLFSLSFTTKPDAGDDGLDFLRPDAYTAEQVLVEIADLVTHPDNAHIGSIEVRRVGRVIGAVTDLAPVSLNGNASAGFSFESTHIASDVPSCLVTDSHEVAAEVLVGLLNDQGTTSVKLYW